MSYVWTEEARHDLIRVLARAGRPAAALRQYHELERVLQAHPEAVCEMPWTSAERPEDASPDTPPQWRNHVIDRSFVVEGVRWIIDYKTTRHDEMPEDSPAWQAYTRQLVRYQRLLAPEGRPVRLAVFFTRSGRLRPLPDTPEIA